MVHFVTGSFNSMARVQSVDEKAVFDFVSDANAHQSECLESVSPADRHGRDALDICNLSGCEQLVLCSTHISGSNLGLVTIDVPDIVDVFGSLAFHSALQITALSVVFCVLSNLCRSTMSEVLFF